MKKTNKKSSLALTSLLALLVVGLVGGTFAWFTDQADFKNEFKTGDFSDEIWEEFVPEDNWTPGATVDKKVFVKNTGDVPIVARVKFSEEWTNGASNSFQKADGSWDAAAVKNFATDLENKGWILITEPDENGVEYPVEAYYTKVLNKDDVTTTLLESVTMNKDIPTTTYSKATYYDEKGDIVTDPEAIENKQYAKVVYTTSSSSDYENAQYTLNIHVETVQANAEAIKETWVGAKTDLDALIKKLGL